MRMNLSDIEKDEVILSKINKTQSENTEMLNIISKYPEDVISSAVCACYILNTYMGLKTIKQSFGDLLYNCIKVHVYTNYNKEVDDNYCEQVVELLESLNILIYEDGGYKYVTKNYRGSPVFERATRAKELLTTSTSFNEYKSTDKMLAVQINKNEQQKFESEMLREVARIKIRSILAETPCLTVQQILDEVQKYNKDVVPKYIVYRIVNEMEKVGAFVKCACKPTPTSNTVNLWALAKDKEQLNTFVAKCAESAVKVTETLDEDGFAYYYDEDMDLEAPTVNITSPLPVYTTPDRILDCLGKNTALPTKDIAEELGYTISPICGYLNNLAKLGKVCKISAFADVPKSDVREPVYREITYWCLPENKDIALTTLRGAREMVDAERVQSSIRTHVLNLLKEKEIVSTRQIVDSIRENISPNYKQASVHRYLDMLRSNGIVVSGDKMSTTIDSARNTSVKRKWIFWSLIENKDKLEIFLNGTTGTQKQTTETKVEETKVAEVDIDTTELEEEQNTPVDIPTEVDEFDNADFFIKTLHPIFLRKVGCSINQLLKELDKETVDCEELTNIQNSLNFATCNYLLTYRIVENIEKGKRIYVYTLPHKMDRLRNAIASQPDTYRDITSEVEGLMSAPVSTLKAALDKENKRYNLLQKIVKKLFGV